ncbi:hypothetical protein BP6252_11587 [Coleophoma cylindrospora]|uniref:Alpha-ketoglutarate-dependent dioxygenase AlkB-like domain-containing protein n=1 Tax=Coleophoma cylindrospora TaxID=1849047 RepID=A0A3D8QL10_9HELO|nr:hypothetical protein BP6252_11587 [Coleophoma cylindrospora]
MVSKNRDLELARELSRSVNANPSRRKTASHREPILSKSKAAIPVTPLRETRSVKRARLSKGSQYSSTCTSSHGSPHSSSLERDASSTTSPLTPLSSGASSHTLKKSLVIKLRISGRFLGLAPWGIGHTAQTKCQDEDKSKSSGQKGTKEAVNIVQRQLQESDRGDLSSVIPTPVKRGRKRKASDESFALELQSSPEKLEDNHKPSSKAIPKSRIAKQLQPYHVNNQEGKPEPYGSPPVWGDKRQQLCETLPYYRAYQSGAYTNGGIVYGFMVDKEVGVRDKFEEEVMIASVGGGRSRDIVSGKMVQTLDQDESRVAQAFDRSMKDRQPVAVIAGRGNVLSPAKLPHYYNILDWFHVTNVWPERRNGVTTWCARLEKIDLATKSWWAPKDSPLVPESRHYGEMTSCATCISCRVVSKEIYNVGWACLNNACKDAYYHFAGGPYVDSQIDYNQEFMQERTPFGGSSSDPIAPPLLTKTDLEAMGAFGFESICKQGIVCPECKCCSRRIEWQKWNCENPHCDFTYSIPHETIPIEDVISRSMTQPSKDIIRGGIRRGLRTLGHYDVSEYAIPGCEKDIGFVLHFQANGIINQQPDGPNDLFRQMQEFDFGLKRSPSRQKDSTGEVLTSHWAANWGAPYKYGVSVLSKGFDEAEPVIMKAVQRLTWAGKHAITDDIADFQPFNELLSIGYFEGTHIGYHDDGEKELGPTVATLSLGAQAVMRFRPKVKSGLGAKCTSGRRTYAEKNSKRNMDCVLQITLRHGDIVHAVDPQGELRFALTCRYVRPEMMANDAEREAARVKGTLPPDSDKYIYDGDINATLPLKISSATNTIQAAMNVLEANILAGNISCEKVTEWADKLLSSETAAEAAP